MQSKGRGSHAPYQATPPMLRSVVGLNCHSSRGGTETLNIRHWAGKQKASLRGGGERTVQDHGTSTSEGYISPLIPMPSAPGHELARLVHGLRTRPVNSGMEPTSICGTGIWPPEAGGKTDCSKAAGGPSGQENKPPPHAQLRILSLVRAPHPLRARQRPCQQS